MHSKNIDFLFIGPSKTASTWIFELLASHPETSLPASKDIYYFDKFYARGLKWYLDHFKHCDSNKVTGEFSHDYILKRHYFDENINAIQRIKKDLPHIKLICCLRDPYERALSGIQFLRRNGMGQGSNIDIAQKHIEIIEGGLYFKNLSNVFDYFPHEQVLVLNFDRLKTSPEDFAQSIFRFLGIDDNYQSELLATKVNPKSKPRNKMLSLFAKKLALVTRNVGLGELVGRLKRNDKLMKLIFKPDKSEYLYSPRDLHFLAQYFEPDLRNLEKLLGWNLRQWKADAKK